MLKLTYLLKLLNRPNLGLSQSDCAMRLISYRCVRSCYT
jgi:hypothetical protein